MKKKFTFLIAALMLLSIITKPMKVWSQTRTVYTFNNSIPTRGWSINGGSQTINSISWTYSSVTYIGATSSKIQVGSSKNPQTTAWTIQTAISNFGQNKKVTAVSITAYTTNTTASYDISVGGSSVKSGNLTTSSSTYSASDLNITNGSVVITLTGSSGSAAMYLSNISVTYEDIPSSPTITVSPASLTGFTYSHGNGPSTSQTFSVSGSSLTANVSVTVPENGNFEICNTQDGTYGNSLTLTHTSGTLASTNVYVRLKSGKDIADNYEGTVTLSSTGATNQTVSLSGSVTGYTVTYNGNGNTGGEVPTDATVYEKNASVTILGNTGSLVKTHYNFAGWTRNIGSTPKTYAPGDTLIINANTTVNAVWTPITHTFSTAVTPGNSGTVVAKDSNNETVASGSAVAETAQLTLTATPAAGYKFTSWSDGGNNSTLSSTTTNPTTFTMGSANVTITATFEERTPITVTWHDGKNGASTRTTNTYTDATFGEANAGALLTPASVNGWTAIGWATSYSSGYPVLVTANTLVGSTTDLYAVYRHGNDVIYQLTTSTSDLSAGTRYMMGYYNSGYLLMTTNFAGTSAVSLNASNQYTYTEGTQWTLGGSNNAWTFTDANGKLLSSQSTTSASASLKNETTATDYSYWSISYDNETIKHSLIQNNGNVSNNSKELKISYYNSVFNCYNNAVVYLFKEVTEYSKTPSAETCTLTYNANGGVGDDLVDDNGGVGYDAGTQVTVKANAGDGNPNFSKVGHTFYCWSDMEDGSDNNANLYEADDKIELNTNTTLYAQWTANTHDYTLTVTGEDADALAELRVDGNAVAANAKIAYGKEVTVNVVVTDGYTYSISVNNGAVTVTNDKFTMPDEDVTVVVTTEVNPYLFATLTSSDLSSMTAATTNQYGYGYLKTKTINANNTTYLWETNGYQHTNNNVVDLGMVQLRVRTNNSGVSYVKLPEVSGKIESIEVAVSGNGNNDNTPTSSTTSTKLYFQEAPTSDGEIIAQGGGTATNTITISLVNKFYSTGYIVANGGLRIWGVSVKYRPYQDMAGTTLPTSIEEDKTVSIPASTNATATDLSIPASSGIIIKSGAKLTVSGTLTNSGNANNLIIEDGGQLITSNAVQATVKKSVSHGGGAKTADNWYTIASPINNPTFDKVTNLIQDPATNYDLYRYDETSMMWENKKNTTDHADFTTLENGRGYLYWNSTGAELSFAGEVNASNVTYDLTCGATNDALKGFNLIGNPFPHNIYKGAGGAIDSDKLADGFYILNNASGWSAQLGYNTPIVPGQGILVQASENVELTITNTNTVATGEKRDSNDLITFNVANDKYEDVAYVQFKDAVSLNKIEHLNAEIPMLYIHQNDENYAIANMDSDVANFDLNFVAATAGEYTLSAKAMGEFEYFHLIDRIAGKDIDMLNEGKYTFTADPADYKYRFTVKLSEETNNSINAEMGKDFAFISNGELIVNGTGTIQIIDMMGRVISTCSTEERISTNGMTAGVYVLQLVNGTDVKTQKMVIR